MNKQGKKSINWIVLSVAVVAVLSLVTIAYAQENNNKNHMPDNDMMDMMGGKAMDAMHKQMTKNINPELRKQMDKMHEACKKNMKENDANNGFQMGMT